MYNEEIAERWKKQKWFGFYSLISPQLTYWPWSSWWKEAERLIKKKIEEREGKGEEKLNKGGSLTVKLWD